MEKRDWSKITLIDNTNYPKKRFELHIDNKIAFIEYILAKGNTIYLTHTEVPETLKGLGIGNQIVKKALVYIREKEYKLVPICPFIKIYIKRHPKEAEGLLKSS
ncbi:GNAT family N-acetyltransferase [Aquimarina algicola]|uniref:N-acetyltransferase n=1 Tax=Aquimarina algicola TaxID=2589995 RepID=A0A504J3S8_9FLAO|nr:GNAT family N-acetyltransferase [Aquimarina algicola]TPN81340.1 N-acetyltransferase [Aquimarina algicola]